MKISVIIPVYNCEKYLERCINSVIHQTYKNLEIILVDDGSTDNSAKICDIFSEKDERVIVIHKKNGGVGAARNDALKVLTGDYISFVDSDDWIEKDMLEYSLQCCLNYNADICSMKYVLATDEKKISKVDNHNVDIYRDNILEYFFQSAFDPKNLELGMCNKLYNSNLFEEIEFPSVKLYEDVYVNYLLFQKAKKIVVSKKYGYYYFQNNVSITRSSISKKSFESLDICNVLLSMVANLNNPKLERSVIAFKCKSCLSLIIRIIDSEEEKNYKAELCLTKSYIKENWDIIKESGMTRLHKYMCFVLIYNFLLFKLLVKYGYSIYQKNK